MPAERIAWLKHCMVGNIECMFRLTEYDLANGIKHCHGSDRWRHGCRCRALRTSSWRVTVMRVLKFQSLKVL